MGNAMGSFPTPQNAGFSDPPMRCVSCLAPETRAGGKYPTNRWAEPVLGLTGGVESAQHCAGDRRCTVATAEFAGLEACAKGAIDRVFDGAGSRGGPGMAMTFGEPIEHEGGGQNHSGRIGEPLAHDIRRGAMTWLEHRMRVADVGGGCHAHAADQAGG